MATSSSRQRRLLDAYRFPGFCPQAVVKGVFGDPKARVVTLVRRGKKLSAAAAAGSSRAGTTAKSDGYATFPAATNAFGWTSKSAASPAGAAAR